MIPLHLVIEVNIKIRKKKRNNDWEDFDKMELTGQENYAVDLDFLNRVQKENLYDKFDKLSSMDAIYGMIAYLEKITLVTMDHDFDKVSSLIKVEFI